MGKVQYNTTPAGGVRRLDPSTKTIGQRKGRCVNARSPLACPDNVLLRYSMGGGNLYLAANLPVLFAGVWQQDLNLFLSERLGTGFNGAKWGRFTQGTFQLSPTHTNRPATHRRRRRGQAPLRAGVLRPQLPPALQRAGLGLLRGGGQAPTAGMAGRLWVADKPRMATGKKG